MKLCDITEGLPACEPFQVGGGEVGYRLAFAIVAMLKGQNQSADLFSQLDHN